MEKLHCTEEDQPLFSADSMAQFVTLTNSGVPVLLVNTENGARIGDGQLYLLENILRSNPQINQAGERRYLLASGLSIQLITGFVRIHTDIDFVLLSSTKIESNWKWYGIHAVLPEQYWAGMKFSSSFLSQTAKSVNLKKDNKMIPVEVVHPGITLIQKISDTNTAYSRKKDKQDLNVLLRYWERVDRGFENEEWKYVITTALEALPELERGRAKSRLKEFIGI